MDPRPWYKKKRYIATLGVVGLLALGVANASPAPAPAPQSSVQAVVHTTASVNNQLSNDNYYTNVDGNSVHSPAYAPSTPAGASAQCRDGTYSFSQHRSGTCSHHGGVAEWL